MCSYVLFVWLTGSADHGQAAVVELLGLDGREGISIQVLGKAKRIEA